MITTPNVKKEPGRLSSYHRGQPEFSRITLFFEQISLEMGWTPGNQIRAYDANSVFLALEAGSEIVGAIHIVRGNTGEGLPLLKVWPEFTPKNITEYADLTLLAIAPTHRGNLRAPWFLIAEAWRYGKQQNLLKVWGTIPVQNLLLYNRIGWPWKKIGPARPYWGDELCYPCMIDLDELEKIVIRRAETSTLHKEVLASMYRGRVA